MDTMYIDIYFLVNLIMDQFSLTCALRQYHLPQHKLWLGAVIGAVGACLWEVSGLPMMLRPVGALLLAFCMVYACIGKRTGRQWIRVLIEVYGYSFLFAGVIPYISPVIPLWIGSVLVSYCGIRVWLFWQDKRKVQDVSVILEVDHESQKLMAVVDTGHQLREPITGKPVVIIRQECLPKQVTPRWPICYKSVQGKGVMFGFWPEKLWIGDHLYKEKEILVAVASEWHEQNWDALVPGYVME